jgi:hypothetical protein
MIRRMQKVTSFSFWFFRGNESENEVFLVTQNLQHLSSMKFLLSDNLLAAFESLNFVYDNKGYVCLTLKCI